MKKEEIIALIDEKIAALKAELGAASTTAGPGNSGPPTPPPPPGE